MFTPLHKHMFKEFPLLFLTSLGYSRIVPSLVIFLLISSKLSSRTYWELQVGCEVGGHTIDMACLQHNWWTMNTIDVYIGTSMPLYFINPQKTNGGRRYAHSSAWTCSNTPKTSCTFKHWMVASVLTTPKCSRTHTKSPCRLWERSTAHYVGSKVVKTASEVGPLVVCTPSHFPSPNIHFLDIKKSLMYWD